MSPNTNMTDLQAMLIHHEGMKKFPYYDTVGKLTIGCGRNLTDRGLSEDEIMHLFNNDIAQAIEDVRHCCSVYDQLIRPRQMVLVSMAFNLGRTKLQGFTQMLSAVDRGDWNASADEMLHSHWATQVGQRAVILAQMMRHGTSEWT